jgi:aminopeptidase N
VFDQPDLKARYTLALEVPAAWEAISNGREISRERTAERSTIRFAETEPISTYLFTFAAGAFVVEEATRDGRAFRMLHRETDAAKVARNRDAIFDLHAGALAWLERYTGIPYPFGKFEFLLVPSFQFGGMEHPGSIYYNASALFLDESATQNQMLGRASLIAHETAHMWFGDLVTMAWFNDVWMKEVFANFMAAKIVNPAFPEINHDLRFFYAHYPAAYGVDRTAGTNAIRQQLDNLNEAGSLYGAIIYQKAPIVMRHLEMLLGEDVFREGMREYLKTYAFGNATWSDLIALLDRRTKEDLAAWSRAWVEEAGRPRIATSIQTVGGRLDSISISQQDPFTARGLTWTQPLELAIVRGDTERTADVRLRDADATFSSNDSGAVPDYVLPNADGVAYGNFVLDPVSREYLLDHLHALDDDLRRGVATVTLWEEMLDGRITPAAMLDTLMRALPLEANELSVQRMLGYTQQAFWRWITPGHRAALAPELEKLLRTGLDAAGTSSLKSAWFNALRDVAFTPGTVAWLERVWRENEKVPGLVLAEPDFITLAQELAVRGVPNAAKILDEQIARTKNPDRRARLAFVRPALSADASTRRQFFGSLARVENRRREAWVLDALGYLHHPLRAESSAAYVLPSLQLLREIQQTGDIFFPKRWMDATLSGHTSRPVAATVRSFVDALPAGYPDRLRRIILSSADDLFRSTGLGQ